MAQPFVAGPCHIYLGVGVGYAPLYLGTAERSPRILIRPHFADVFNDIMGQMIPYDKVFQGEDGFVLADLTRWNEAVFNAYQARPRLGQRGTLQPGDLGSLMKTEGLAYPVWLQFPYATKPAYATQPYGYHFYAAIGEGPDELDNLGTVARRNRINLYCGPVINQIGSQGVGQILYDTLPQSFVGLPPIN